MQKKEKPGGEREALENKSENETYPLTYPVDSTQLAKTEMERPRKCAHEVKSREAHLMREETPQGRPTLGTLPRSSR